MQRFTPLLADAARPCRRAIGDRWCLDETYVKVAGKWRYAYRAVDQYGRIIDAYVSAVVGCETRTRELALQHAELVAQQHLTGRSRRVATAGFKVVTLTATPPALYFLPELS